MKNYLIYLCKNKINILVSGKNLERFIKRLKSNNIEILNLKYKNKEEILIQIYKIDYDKVLKIKTIYDIEIIDYNGFIKYKNNILNNKYIILFILISLISLYILSNMIFSIDIKTDNNNMKKTLYQELENLGIKKYKFKKDYEELQKIKLTILNNHKDDIEWLEIESIGTKYIIKYEPRVITKQKENNNIRNIVASKNAVITSMNISKGNILKQVGSYVNKGEIIVSSDILLNEEIKNRVSSSGVVYGEVWYKVNINFPFNYYKEEETGNKQKRLVIQFLNKDIEIFNKYKNKKVKNKILLSNNLLPIKLIYQQQKEIEVTNKKLNKDTIIDEALKYSYNKIKSNLKEDEYINKYKVLSKEYNKDSVNLEIFYSVIENITEYQEVVE